MEIGSQLKTDIVFLAPPMDCPDYKKYKPFDINKILELIGGTSLYSIAAQISQCGLFFYLKCRYR